MRVHCVSDQLSGSYLENVKHVLGNCDGLWLDEIVQSGTATGQRCSRGPRRPPPHPEFAFRLGVGCRVQDGRSFRGAARRRPVGSIQAHTAQHDLVTVSASRKRDQPLVDGLLARWLCHSRAHPVEQNGSPFLTATSGRSLPQHGQRPFRRGGGSARSACWLPSGTGGPPLLAFAEGRVMPRLSGVDPWSRTKVPGPASRILFAAAPSSRAHEARRQPSGLGRGSGRRASYYECTPPRGRPAPREAAPERRTTVPSRR
jgi:hypothetical protein